MFINKYGVARHIYIPIIKRAVVDFAVSADWTPAAGDVKISKDGGAAASVTNLPVAIAMGNGAIWDYSLTATEMQAAQVVVTTVDSATKAVEDQSFIIQTYGNASALLSGIDFTDGVRLGLTALPNAAASAVGGLPVAVDTSGRVDVLKVNGTSQTAGDIYAKVSGLTFTVANQVDVNVVDWKGAAAAAMTGDAFARLGAPAGASHAADVAAVKADTAAIKVQSDKLVFTVPNQVDVNVVDWKGAAAAAMTGDAYARLGAPAGASVSADVAAIKADTGTILTDVNTGAGAIYTRIGAPVGASISADIAAVQAKTVNLPASPAAVSDIPTANGNADALLDRANAIETGWSVRGILRIMAATLAGKVSGGGTVTNTFRNVTDTKDRVTSTVDSSGNRTAETLDGS